MLEKTRTYIGWCLVALGVILLGAAIKNHTKLWAGVQTVTKEVIVTKEVLAETHRVPKNTQQEKLASGQFDTGNLEIQERYVLKESNLPSGAYQVMDVNNVIWMLTLCQAQDNGVLPLFKQGSVVNIVYTKEEGCRRFVSATLVKGATE